MKEFLDSFKQYKDSLNEDAGKTEMKISVLVVIDKKVDRYKEHILSNIRSIAGVTVINVEQHKNVGNLDYNVVLMKFDVYPYQSPDPSVPVNVLKSLLSIRGDLLKIPGIIRVKYLTKPEKF